MDSINGTSSGNHSTIDRVVVKWKTQPAYGDSFNLQGTSYGSISPYPLPPKHQSPSHTPQQATAELSDMSFNQVFGGGYSGIFSCDANDCYFRITARKQANISGTHAMVDSNGVSAKDGCNGGWGIYRPSVRYKCASSANANSSGDMFANAFFDAAVQTSANYPANWNGIITGNFQPNPAFGSGSTVGASHILVPVHGCTDSTATNYNPDADYDDGSCTY